MCNASSAFMVVRDGAMAMAIADVPAVHVAGDGPRALFTLSILTGIAMPAAGLLRLGSLPVQNGGFVRDAFPHRAIGPEKTLLCRGVVVFLTTDGAKRARTADLLGAIQALSQLSYGPVLRAHCSASRAPESGACRRRRACRPRIAFAISADSSRYQVPSSSSIAGRALSPVPVDHRGAPLTAGGTAPSRSRTRRPASSSAFCTAPARVRTQSSIHTCGQRWSLTDISFLSPRYDPTPEA